MQHILFVFSNELNKRVYAPFVGSVSDYGYRVDQKVDKDFKDFDSAVYDLIFVDVGDTASELDTHVKLITSYSNSREVIEDINHWLCSSL